MAHHPIGNETFESFNAADYRKLTPDHVRDSAYAEMSETAAVTGREASHALRFGTGELRPEILVPRLGEHLVHQGLLSEHDLERALHVQAWRSERGEKVLLGQLLVEMGLITPEILDQAAVHQALQLQKALRHHNQKLERRVLASTCQLKNALVKLSELSELKADFVANVSHELRTPLTLLSGFAEMLASESLGPLNEEQAMAMNSVVGATERLHKLIEDLLQFSESSMGVIPLDISAISLEKPVNRAIDQTWEIARKRPVNLESKLPQNLPQVRADRQKIGWVISEFLRNAIKFTPVGGFVWIKATPSADAVTVSVTDTGIGIPADRIEEAFEPFHQLDGSMERRYGGTGLGLALAKRIVEAHGSSIDILSREGLGTRVAFSLPLAC